MGLNYYITFIGEEIALRLVQQEFIARLLQPFFIFSLALCSWLKTQNDCFSALYETSIFAEGVGNKIGEHNFNWMLNHTNRTKLTFCGNRKLLLKNAGCQGSFSGRGMPVLNLAWWQWWNYDFPDRDDCQNKVTEFWYWTAYILVKVMLTVITIQPKNVYWLKPGRSSFFSHMYYQSECSWCQRGSSEGDDSENLDRS